MKFLVVFVALVAAATAFPAAWTLDELSHAINDPATDPALKPFLIHALNELMDSMWNGEQITAIPVVTPVGIIPSPSMEAPIATPVIVVEDAVEVSPAVVEPTPAVVAEAPAASLVQIIINVNAKPQEAVNPAPVATPELVEETVAVEPVSVVEQAVVQPEPVSVVEVAPETVSVVEAVPEPVAVVDVVPEAVIVTPEFNPIDVIAVGGETNPIDVVAVSAPEVNPVDVISPVAAVGASAEGILV